MSPSAGGEGGAAASSDAAFFRNSLRSFPPPAGFAALLRLVGILFAIELMKDPNRKDMVAPLASRDGSTLHESKQTIQNAAEMFFAARRAA